MARIFTRASSHYLDNGAAVVTGNTFSIAGWVKPSATTNNQGIFSLGSSSANQRHLLYTGSALSLHLFSGNGATTGQAGTGFGTVLTNGVWNHVCGVHSNTNARAVYLNNGGTSNTNSTNVTGITPNRTYVGAYYTNGALQAGYYQDGCLAEFGVWTIALSSDERQALADGMSPLLVRPDALVGYWPLMGRTSPEIDQLGGYPLTVTGAAQADHPPMRYPGRVHLPILVVGGATVIDLTSASFGFTGNSNQPSVRSSLTQASFDFTANPIQPKTTVGLTAAAFNFTANAISLGGQTIIDLSRASFNFTANAINVIKDTTINLTTAAFNFAGKVINISTPPIPGGSSGGGMFMALAGFFKKRRYRQKLGKHE